MRKATFLVCLAMACGSSETPGAADAPIAPADGALGQPDASSPDTAAAADASPADVSAADAAPVTLTVLKAGQGNVSSAPAGIACDAGCSATSAAFLPGTNVMLEAKPAPGYYFQGWAGTSCGTRRFCSVTVAASTTVSARFPPMEHNLIFATSAKFDGDLGGLDGADAKCRTAAEAAGLSGTFVAYLSTETVNARDRLLVPGTTTPARGFVRLDGLPVTDTVDDLGVAHRVWYAVKYDENGEPLDWNVDATWTGSDTSGGSNTNQTCDFVQLGGDGQGWPVRRGGGGAAHVDVVQPGGVHARRYVLSVQRRAALLLHGRQDGAPAGAPARRGEGDLRDQGAVRAGGRDRGGEPGVRRREAGGGGIGEGAPGDGRRRARRAPRPRRKLRAARRCPRGDGTGPHRRDREREGARGRRVADRGRHVRGRRLLRVHRLVRARARGHGDDDVRRLDLDDRAGDGRHLPAHLELASNLLGADVADAERRIQKVVPGYMSMGHGGMGGMGEMAMAVPPNSVPMKGADGPFGYIDMGGMFTIVKIRERLPEKGDPGWYKHPEGSVSAPATAEQLRRDGIDVHD